MNGKFTLIVTTLVMLLLGVVMIVFHADDKMAEMIAIALGVLFLAPSLFSAIMLLFVNVPVEDSRYNPRYNLIPVIGGLSVGLVIVINAALFVPLLKYLFAVLLIVGGLYYVFYLVFARARVIVPSWYYVLPLLVTASGFAALSLPIDDNSLMFLISGISMLALAFTGVVVAFTERAVARAKAAEQQASQAATEQVAAPEPDDSPEE
ncbi:MAG: hypothetical protein ACI308_07340 [Muribaculaceae bacterium]